MKTQAKTILTVTASELLRDRANWYESRARKTHKPREKKRNLRMAYRLRQAAGAIE